MEEDATQELPPVLSEVTAGCPTFAAVLLHHVLPGLSPGNVSAARLHSGPAGCPTFAAVVALQRRTGTLAQHAHLGDDGVQHFLANPHAHMYAAYSPAFSLHLSSVFKL